MMKNLIIIGASGHGKVCADIAELMGCYDEIYFLDDTTKGACFGHKIIGKVKDFMNFINDADFFVAIGNAKIREKIFSMLEEYNANITVLVHPSSKIARDTKIADGTVIEENAVIKPDSKIGKGCIINTNSVIAHDVIIEDFVHVSIGACIAGTVYVGKGSWLGIGSIVKNNISIASNCMIGAGAVVVSDIDESGTYIGVPAKKIK